MNTKYYTAIILIVIYIFSLPFINAQEVKKLSNHEQAIKDMKGIFLQIRVYQMLCGTLPSETEGIAAVVKKPKDAPESWKQLMYGVPTDPWGREYIYKLTPNTLYGFTIHCKGENPDVKADDFYISTAD